MEYHRLLQRQIKNETLTEEQLQNLAPFLEKVSEAYHSFQADILQIEHTLEQSSKELFLANQELANRIQTVSNRLTSVTDNIKDVIFEIDLNGKWTYLNQAWESLTGHTVASTIGKSYVDYLPKNVSKTLKNSVRDSNQSLTTKKNTFKTQNHLGEWIWLDVSVTPMKTNQGGLERFIGTIVDVTKQKNAEEELLKAMKAKDEFLSTMSHEIRTPLNAVIGTSNLLILEDPLDRQLENLNILKYSSNHLLSLVNDILDYSKISAGHLKLENDRFSLYSILENKASIFFKIAKEKEIEFKVIKGNGLPDEVGGDAMRLSQILYNLVQNAIKFTHAGGVTLYVNLIKTENEKHFIKFEIIDTGIGIKKEDILKIFNPFTQASSNTTRLYGGTGLGLSICQNLIQIMGGNLKLDSVYGRGSNFNFTIPFSRLSSSVKDQVEQLINEDDNGNEMNLSGHILIVEDNKLNFIVLKKFLEKWGLTYDLALNGLEGLQWASSKAYDLILMDLQMPVMDGFECSKSIRNAHIALNKEVPIYALSASTGTDITNQVKDAKMDGLLLKPFDPTDLKNTIARALQKAKI